MLEEKGETSPTKEETQKIGNEFLLNYVSCLFVIITQFKKALRRDGTPLPPNKYAVFASQIVGNFVVGGAAFACGGLAWVGACAKVGGEVSSYGMKLLLGRKQKKNAKKLIKLITGEDSVTLLEEQAQKAQDELELEEFSRAGAAIFEIYECQIVSLKRLTKEGSWKGNLEKISVEAAKRSINFLMKLSKQKERLTFNADMLVNGVIKGKSDGNWKSILPSPINKKIYPGKQIKTERGKVLTKNVFEQVGVNIRKCDFPKTKLTPGQYRVNKPKVKVLWKIKYNRRKAITPKYGCRLVAPFESISIKGYFNSTSLGKRSSHWKYLINKEIKESIIRQIKENFKRDEAISYKSCEEVEHKNFNVRDPINPCASRTNEVNQLLEWFNEKKSPVLIHAMGGQGKSELCRQFVQKLRQKENPPVVTWFCVDNALMLLQSVSEFAGELSISVVDSEGKKFTISSLVNKISKKINGSWLVIIDNIDEFYPEYKQALNSFQQFAFVVVTSRRSDILNSSHRIDLPELDVKAAHEFVKSSIIHPIQEDKWVEKLCKYLQNYALPLHQSVAMINHKQCVGDGSYGIQNFLELLEDNMQSALSKHMDNTDYDITTFNVFDATIKELKESEMTLLSILSLTNPDRIINDFLKKLYAMVEKDGLFLKNLETLKTLSLIGVNSGVVSIHRVVQKIVQVKMKSDRLKKWKQIWLNIMHKFNIKTLNMEEIDNLMRIWDSESQIFVKNYSEIPRKVAFRFHGLCMYISKQNLLNTSLATNLFIEHKVTLAMEGYVAISYIENWEYEEALKRMEVFWEERKKNFGEKDRATLFAANQVAFILGDLGRLDESLELHKKVLESYLEVYGENHFGTVNTRNHISLALIQQESNDKVIVMLEKLFKWKENKLGAKHPENLSIRHNIASCYQSKGMFQEAKKEFEEMLELRIKILGEDHEETIQTKCWLSTSLHSLGQKKEALEMLNEVLVFREKTLGLTNSATFIIRKKIADWNNEMLTSETDAEGTKK